MKKANIFIWVVILIIVIISGSLIFLNIKGQPSAEGEKEAFQEQEIKEEVILVIDDGRGEPKSLKAEFFEGMTVFDLLIIKTKELDLTLKRKIYDIGTLIEAIGDRTNGQDGRYWMYYVNGEMPMVSVDKNEIRPRDKVEFKFEEPSF